MSAPIVVELPDPAATDAFGASLAATLEPGTVVTLSGDLGAGKTALIRALLRSLGVSGPVKSPTYTLVEPYKVSNLYLYHFDLYRFSDPDEWEAAGFREYFRDDAVGLIEWPERAEGLIPAPDVAIRLDYHDLGRVLTMAANTPKGDAWLTRIRTRITS